MFSLSAISNCAGLLLLACWVIAAFSDLRTMTIPNWISIVLVTSFAVLAPLAGLPLVTFGYCLLAGICTFAVCFILFALNMMGGGDAKLLSVSALWFGFNHHLIGFLVLVALFGGALTLLIVLLRSNLPIITLLKNWLPTSLTNGKQIPYGVAIAASGLSNLGDTVFQQL